MASMGALAKGIALPAEHLPSRYPAFPALERSSVLSFRHSGLVSVTSEATRALLVRDAVYPLWMDTDIFGMNSTYSYWFTEMNSRSMVVNASTMRDEWVNLPDPEYGSMCGSTKTDPDNTSPLWAGDSVGSPWVYPIVGMDDKLGGLGFFYVPSGCNVGMSVNTILASNNLVAVTGAASVSIKYQASFEQWVNPGRVKEQCIVECATSFLTGTNGKNSSVGIAINGGLFGPGWYRLSLLRTSVSMNGGSAGDSFLLYPESGVFRVQIYVAGGTLTWTPPVATPYAPGKFTVAGVHKLALVPATTPKEFSNSVLPWRDTRVTAVSALFTNVTKVLNKEGTVKAGRLHFNVGFSAETIDELHPMERAFLGLANGFYTYSPPTGSSADYVNQALETNSGMRSEAFYTSSSSGNYVPCFNLGNTSLAHGIVFSDPDGGTNLALNMDLHLEFRSSSSLFPIGMSSVTVDQFQVACLALSQVGYFFSNEDHEKGIDRVKAISKSVAGWLGKLAPVVSQVHPGVGGVMKAIGKFADQPKHEEVKPTALPAPTPRNPSRSGSVDSRASKSSTSSMKKKKAVVVLSKAAKKRARKKALG